MLPTPVESESVKQSEYMAKVCFYN